MAVLSSRRSDAWVSVGTPPLIPGPGQSIAMPDATNTGPRVAITGSTLTGSQAIAAAQANGGVLVGRRIQNITLSQPEHGLLTFRDCEISGAFFAVDAWFGQGVAPAPSVRATFDHCLFDRADAALVAGSNYRLLHCRLRRGVDLIKSSGNAEIFACWGNDLWEPSGAHGDVFQAQNGNDILIHWNRFECVNSADSPDRPGGMGSGVTQLGYPFGALTNFRFLDNWVDGGAYQVRGGGAWVGSSPFAGSGEFRRNKHGRNWIYGPVADMGSFDNGRAVWIYDNTNVFTDTGTPVLGG